MQSRFILSQNSRANYSPCRRRHACSGARRVCVRLHVRVMIEERGSENEPRFAKPSFAARPMRLDPSHFYHPGLATTDESRIGCGGMNERGGRRRRGWAQKGKKDRASCRVPLAPLRTALRVSLRASPFLRRTNQPAALSLQLFAGFNHLATRSDARRGLVGLSRNPRFSVAESGT